MVKATIVKKYLSIWSERRRDEKTGFFCTFTENQEEETEKKTSSWVVYKYEVFYFDNINYLILFCEMCYLKRS